MIQTETYILPAYWASALINDDYSGMNDEEIAILNTWYDKIKPGSCVGCSEVEYFTWRNDAYTIGCNVLEFYFHSHNS